MTTPGRESRAVHARRSAPAFIALLATAVAIIVGLLGMHVLNAHATATGHYSSAAVPVGHSMSGHAHDAGDGVTAHAGATLDPRHPETAGRATVISSFDAGCADCAGTHAMAWMSCILALLGTLLLLVGAAALGREYRASDILRRHLIVERLTGAPPRPPSLIVLGISRT